MGKKNKRGSVREGREGAVEEEERDREIVGVEKKKRGGGDMRENMYAVYAACAVFVNIYANVHNLNKDFSDG